jgi:hypothetical protein
MKPIKFKEANTVYGKGQESLEELPALRFDDGEVVSCWKLSLWEALRLLFTRRVWLCVATFNKPLQPTYMSTQSKDLFVPNK